MHPGIEIKDKAKNVLGIKTAVFRKHIRKTNPHTHNSYLELVYLIKGTGEHTIDTSTYTITPPVLYIVKENQLHFWDIASEPEGYVLILKKLFVDRYFDFELQSLTAQLKYHSKLSIVSSDAPVINSLFELLIVESGDADKAGIVMLSLLKALFAKLLSNQTYQQATAKNNLFSNFIELLSSSKNLVNSVAHYAKLLHTTPQNLNAACKKEMNESASSVLATYIISEANRLLVYSQLSISEIAYRLGFKDNSHFTKYFKKNTGIMPSALRKSV